MGPGPVSLFHQPPDLVLVGSKGQGWFWGLSTNWDPVAASNPKQPPRRRRLEETGWSPGVQTQLSQRN